MRGGLCLCAIIAQLYWRPTHVDLQLLCLPAGPSISLDTACSSSLSTTHLTQRMLLEGRCAKGLATAGELQLIN